MVMSVNLLRTLHFNLLLVVLGCAAHVGCGRVAGYPEAVITSPIGREGVCVACSKKIGTVKQSNLVTVAGNQFIVCDEACAKKAEGVTEHSHSH
jgi:hypothetical protein